MAKHTKRESPEMIFCRRLLRDNGTAMRLLEFQRLKIANRMDKILKDEKVKVNDTEFRSWLRELDDKHKAKK
jgi:hypothetical protein